MPLRFPIREHTAQRGVMGMHFSKGPRYANWRPSGSGDWLLLVTMSGAGIVGDGRSLFPTRAGDLVLFAKDHPHYYATAPAAGRWEFRWSHFTPRPAWDMWLRWPELIPGTRRLHLPPGAARRDVLAAMARVEEWSRRGGPCSEDLRFNALEAVLLRATAELPATDATRLDPRVTRAITWLTAEIRRPFSLAELARECGTSVSRLAHLFKDQTGETPQRFAERRKMLHAADLLRGTPLTIAEVAEACGYANAFYFSTRFRAWSGRSPVAFRKQHVL